MFTKEALRQASCAVCGLLCNRIIGTYCLGFAWYTIHCTIDYKLTCNDPCKKYIESAISLHNTQFATENSLCRIQVESKHAKGI